MRVIEHRTWVRRKYRQENSFGSTERPTTGLWFRRKDLSQDFGFDRKSDHMTLSVMDLISRYVLGGVWQQLRRYDSKYFIKMPYPSPSIWPFDSVVNTDVWIHFFSGCARVCVFLNSNTHNSNTHKSLMCVTI